MTFQHDLAQFPPWQYPRRAGCPHNSGLTPIELNFQLTSLTSLFRSTSSIASSISFCSACRLNLCRSSHLRSLGLPFVRRWPSDAARTTPTPSRVQSSIPVLLKPTHLLCDMDLQRTSLIMPPYISSRAARVSFSSSYRDLTHSFDSTHTDPSQSFTTILSLHQRTLLQHKNKHEDYRNHRRRRLGVRYHLHRRTGTSGDQQA